MNPNNVQSKILVQCPHCKNMVRQDRLKNHLIRAHTSSASGKPLVISIQRKQRKNKKTGKHLTNLQHGKITEDIPSAKFGMAEGSILKVKNKVRYEQAPCSCNGENERCIRCDGTGFYARKMIEESNSSKSSTKRVFKSNSSKTIQESNFSNDYRGGDFGIREIGRFNSNPLHDDHD